MPQKQKLERLDKVIAAQTDLSRRDVQRLAGRGQISVNGESIKKADLKIDPDTDVVMVSEIGRASCRERVFRMV